MQTKLVDTMSLARGPLIEWLENAHRLEIRESVILRGSTYYPFENRRGYSRLYPTCLRKAS